MFCRYPKTLAAVALWLSAVSAINLSEPSLLKEAAQAHRHGAPAPSPTAFRRFINKRQTTESPTYTVTAAPDSTCGFLSASAGNAITCENGGFCSWENDYVTAVMCQNRVEINMKLACIEKVVAEDNDQCNDVCQSNEFNLLCTESSAPYCRTYQFPGGLRDYRCASTSVTAIQSVDFTYRGQDDREFSTVILGGESTTPTSAEGTTSDRPSRSTTSDASETSTESSTPSPSESGSGGGGGGGGGTNIGAIVGGAVGGAALLAIIGFGIYFMRRRSKKNAAQSAVAAAPPPGPPMQQQQPPPMYPSNPASPMDPNAYGWKGGAASPVHSPVAGSPHNQQPYDAVSDVSRMSNVYSPSAQTPTPMQQQQQPPTIHEASADQSGHHRGQIHEMQ